ncbi:MAG: hypothetical protein ACYDEY_05025 [Acidimicrobiales bacterium]
MKHVTISKKSKASAGSEKPRPSGSRETWQRDLWLAITGVTVIAVIAFVTAVLVFSERPSKATIKLSTLEAGAGLHHHSRTTAAPRQHATTTNDKGSTTSSSVAASPHAKTHPAQHSSPVVPPAVIQNAARAALASGSAHVSTSIALGSAPTVIGAPSGPGVPRLPSPPSFNALTVPMATGILDFSTGEGMMTTTTALPTAGSPSGSISAKPTPMTVIATPTALYIPVLSQATSTSSSSASTSQWYELQNTTTTSTAAATAGTAQGQAFDEMLFDFYDPQMWLGLIAQATSSTTTGATATVSGAAATEYQATIPAPFQAPSANQATLTAQIWLDAQGRIVQFAVPNPAPGSSTGSPLASTQILVTFSQFGAPVTIALPPAQDVKPFPTDTKPPTPTKPPAP